MKKYQMVDLLGQYKKIKPELDAAIQSVIESSAFINGPEVRDFQKNLETYLGVSNVITCANGTDALQLALMSLGLKPGDEVITTPFTFVATAEAIALLGLRPVFVDAKEETFNIDINQIERAITEKTKAIMPVHLYGQCANMETIMEIATRHNLYVIEDAAQSLGADYCFSNGMARKAGTIGHIGCTSFFPSKNLGCYGDGGAVFTNNNEIAAKIRSIANHGSKVKYYHEMIGVNSRLDTIQAAILNVKLKYLDQYNAARQRAADFYDHAFGNIPQLTIPARRAYSTHIFHQYTLKLNGINRQELVDFLNKKNIPTMVYYPVPMHLQKAYSFCGYKKGDFPIAEYLSENVISLPIHSEILKNDLEFISSAVVEFCNKRK
jgi:UDP-2-acetamido-2-deoxy-ribo-hexuluronate aminotransferase